MCEMIDASHFIIIKVVDTDQIIINLVDRHARRARNAKLFDGFGPHTSCSLYLLYLTYT